MWSIGNAVAVALLLIVLASCSSGGGESTPTPAPPSAGSVILTGTVSGTVIWILNAITDEAVVPSFDTATLNQAPPFPFNISNIPTGVALRIFFVTGGAIYPLYVGNTNVFTFTSGGTVPLGRVTTDIGSGRATPTMVPSNITPEKEDTDIPQFVIPHMASVSVTNPVTQAQVEGPDVPITFALQNFTIGNQNQAHLHVYLDNDPTPYEFLNAPPVLYNGFPAADAQWASGTQIRFLSLSTNAHTVQFRLSTASHVEYVNPEASTSVQFFVQPPPSNPPTINVTSPMDNQTLPFGPVTVAFNVTDFMIQGQGQRQLHFYLDGNNSNLYQFLNNGTGQVLLNGNPIADVEWVTNSSFRFNTLSGGPHSLRLVLANGDAANTELANSQATDIVNFMVDVPPPGGNPMVTISQPQSNAILPAGPVRVEFGTTNFTIGNSGSMPHLHFYVANDPIRYEFFTGSGITEDNGVQYQGSHTHFAHWKNSTSFELYALGAGTHQIRLVLADASHDELGNVEATASASFTINVVPGGELLLQEMITGLNFPVAMAFTPDRRLFVNEKDTGLVRTVDTATWQLQADFCSVPTSSVFPGTEMGLLGITIDPNFSVNHYVYVYHTVDSPFRNQVVRYTDSSGTCTNPTIILDNLPASGIHNGGIIHFGPDQNLYVMVGDAAQPDLAQDLTFLGGKILRVKRDGLPADGNPFIDNSNADPRIYTFGHRNSFGFTFHPSNGNLWQTENGPGQEDDEINHILIGGNYGWPTVHGIANTPPFIDPIAEFNPSIAPTNIVAINSAHYPASFQNNLLFGDFVTWKLRRLILDQATLTHLGQPPIESFSGSEPIIGLALGPDGFIYATSLSAIHRVVPAP
jgi:glucose/arabinose dehydrogenase